MSQLIGNDLYGYARRDAQSGCRVPEVIKPYRPDSRSR